jgi:hypothetical protein
MTLKTNKGALYISVAMPKLKFEKLDVSTLSANTIVNRAKIPGGWLLVSTSTAGGGVTFYPDPEHKWDGGSVANEHGKTALAVPRAS